MLDDNSFNNLDAFAKEFGDQAAFALALLAKISLKTDRRSRAIEALQKSLKLNPFLWSSFTILCDLGEKPNPNNIFQCSSIDNWSTCHDVSINNVENNAMLQATPNQQSFSYITPNYGQTQLNCVRFNSSLKSTPEDTPLANPLLMSGLGLLPTTKIKQLRYRFGAESPVSSQPSFGILPTDSPDNFIVTPLVAQSTLSEVNDQHNSLAKKVKAHMGQLISRKESHLPNNKPLSSNVGHTIPLTPSTPAPMGGIQSNVRRSSRLFSNSCSVKENNKSPNRNKSPKSPSRKTKQRISKYNLNKTSTYAENAKNRIEKGKNETITSVEAKNTSTTSVNSQTVVIQKQSAEGLMSLLRDMGQAYLHLSQYNCEAAITELTNLPTHQYTTTWVYSMIGLAYFELTDYDNCIKCFEEIHNREPYETKYMDIYSTALWHTQKESILSSLALDLMQYNRNSAATWCVAGNCFSLHKEHDTAIKFFERAVQVEPNFAYSYSLLGHEYIVTDELDKAMSCFRNALRINPRHYNAWFGIGSIYSKQERYQLAEMNYAKALTIHPRSAVLMCHIGVVQQALKKTEKALKTFNMAINFNKKNPLCRFHRSSVYFSLGRHAEALNELEQLKEIVPKESLVYYLIGKVHKKLGNTDLALMNFSWATDLDPKGASSQIREAFDPAVEQLINAETPTTEDYHSERAGIQQQSRFNELPEEDSDDSI